MCKENVLEQFLSVRIGKKKKKDNDKTQEKYHQKKKTEESFLHYFRVIQIPVGIAWLDGQKKGDSKKTLIRFSKPNL